MNPDFLHNALNIAIRAHTGQVRKCTDIPYISHPMAVAAMVLENGGDVEQAAAGLLHDVIEDGGRIPWEDEILNQCGSRVLRMVRDVSKSKTIETRQERDKEYLLRMLDIPLDSLLIAACDKAHNCGAILTDYFSIGDSVFQRFTKTREETLDYYRALAGIMSSRLPAVIATQKLCGSLLTLEEAIRESEKAQDVIANGGRAAMIGGQKRSIILPH